jgi:hypothetical protein
MQVLTAIRRWYGRVTYASRELVEPYAFHFNPQEPDFFKGGLQTEPDAGTVQAAATSK